jgi:hypothetical protein
MSTFAIINHRAGDADDWTAANPVLEIGELGFEVDTNKIKIGDGQKTWSQLSYVGGSTLSPAQQRVALEVFNNQTAVTPGTDPGADRIPFAGKIFIADPVIVGSTGSNLDGATAGDLWFW